MAGTNNRSSQPSNNSSRGYARQTKSEPTNNMPFAAYNAPAMPFSPYHAQHNTGLTCLSPAQQQTVAQQIYLAQLQQAHLAHTAYPPQAQSSAHQAHIPVQQLIGNPYVQHGSSLAFPRNFAYNVYNFIPSQATMLPQAFQTMTLQQPNWNMDTWASSPVAEYTGTELVGTNFRPTTLSGKEDMAFKGSTSSMKKHSISLKGGASYFRFIKEKGGSKPQELEKKLEIKMIFPTLRNEDSIIIEGASSESIARAAKIIQPIIDKAAKSSALDNSHFISLPLAIHPKLVDKLVNFQNSASKSFSLSDKSIFIEPKMFHLTVLMLRLNNKERVDDAVKILKGIAGELKDALGGQPVSIKLKGLDILRGSEDKAEVLFAPVEVVGGQDRLLHVYKVIIDAFIKGGLVFEKDCQRELKLHATVMNARQRTFDARGILEKYGSENWGEYCISQVHLSQRFDVDANGYYHCCASIPLP